MRKQPQLLGERGQDLLDPLVQPVVRGAALTVTYSDAVAYDGENNASVTNLPAGYTQNSLHAPVVPASTVLRAAGSPAQYFWDGSQLHPVSDPATSGCLLSHYPQTASPQRREVG